MAVWFDVRRLGDGRVRILGEGPDLEGADDLLAWLEQRGDVVDVRVLEERGTIEVRYQEASVVPGGFVRALRDRLHVLAKTEPEDRTIHVAHSLHGRARLRYPGASDDAIGRLAALAATLPGVSKAMPSPATQAVLVTFDPAETSADRILDGVLAVDPEAWPLAPRTAPSGGGWGLQAFNTAVLGATFLGALPPPAMAAAVALTAIPSVKRAARALGDKRLGVDLLDVAADRHLDRHRASRRPRPSSPGCSASAISSWLAPRTGRAPPSPS